MPCTPLRPGRPQCRGIDCSWAKDLTDNRTGLGEAGSCGTKQPLQQELKGPCASFLEILPCPGMASTLRSELLSSAQGQDSWRSKDPADKRANLGGGGSCGTKKPLQQELEVPCSPLKPGRCTFTPLG